MRVLAKKQAIGEAQIVAEVSGDGGCRVCPVEALGVLFEVTGRVALVDETGRNGDAYGRESSGASRETGRRSSRKTIHWVVAGAGIGCQ